MKSSRRKACRHFSFFFVDWEEKEAGLGVRKGGSIVKGWESRMGGVPGGGFSAIVGELRLLCEEICYCKGILTRKLTLRLLLRRRVWGQIYFCKNPPPPPPLKTPHLIFPRRGDRCPVLMRRMSAPPSSRAFAKGWFPKRVVLADVPGPQSPERGYKNQNEGTITAVPGPQKPARGYRNRTTVQETGTRANFATWLTCYRMLEGVLARVLRGGFPWKGIRSSTLASTPSSTPNFPSTLPSTLPSHFLGFPISPFCSRSARSQGKFANCPSAKPPFSWWAFRPPKKNI